MMAGHLNGSGRKSGEDDKVASLDEARRRAAARAKEEARRPSAPRPGGAVPAGALTARDWLVGAVVMAMALGMIWHWLAPLVGAKGLVR